MDEFKAFMKRNFMDEFKAFMKHIFDCIRMISRNDNTTSAVEFL